jgi:hypothetical protein
VEASLTATDECKDGHVPIEEETQTTAGEGEKHKTTVLTISKDEVWIHERMSSRLGTTQLDVPHNQYRCRPTATEKG